MTYNEYVLVFELFNNIVTEDSVNDAFINELYLLNTKRHSDKYPQVSKGSVRVALTELKKELKAELCKSDLSFVKTMRICLALEVLGVLSKRTSNKKVRVCIAIIAESRNELYIARLLDEAFK